MSNSKPSEIWNYFTVKPGNADFAICNTCKREFKRGKDAHSYSTSPLIKHLQDKHSDLYKKYLKDKKSAVEKQNTTAQSSVRLLTDSASASQDCNSKAESSYPIMQSFLAKTPYDKSHAKQKEFEDRLAMWLFDQMLPYRTIEKESFKKLIAHIDPRLTVPSEKKIRTETMPRMYTKLLEYLRNFVNENVDWASPTIDFWTSKSNHAFMSFCIHFITKQWERKIAVLNCVPFDDSHTIQNIGNQLNEVLFQWSIETKVVTVVTDNARNLLGALEEVAIPRSACALHTMQLVIRDNIGKNPAQRAVADLISRASNLVAHFHRSPAAADKLRKAQETLEMPEMRLIIDQETRWNSEYDMLFRLNEQEKAVKMVCLSADLRLNVNQKLTDNDWKILKPVVTVLTPFKNFTLTLQRDDASISEVLMLLSKLKRQLRDLPSDQIYGVKTLRDELLKSIEKRFHKPIESDVESIVSYNIENEPIFALASVLDPRCKDRYFENKSSFSDAKTALIDELSTLTAQNQNDSDVESMSPPSKRAKAAAPPSTKPKKAGSSSACIWDPWDSGEGSEDETDDKETTNNPKAIVEDYLAQPRIEMGENPLLWWKKHESRWPKLAILARKYLCPAASNVSSESAFKYASDIASKERSRLLPENVEKLLFLRCNLSAINFDLSILKKE